MSDVNIFTSTDVIVTSQASVEVVETSSAVVEVVELAMQGPPGPTAFVSTDPDNRTVLGTDGGFYTPDIAADPLAYYILAKA